MSNNVTLVRFFDKEIYAQEFLSGKLRLRKLRYYRDLESEGRGDRSEGTSSIYAPYDSTLRLGVEGEKLQSIDDGLVSVKIAFNSDLDSHVLCMTKAYFKYEDKYVQIDFGDLGRLVADFCGSDFNSAHVVIITDPNAFVRRLKLVPFLRCWGPVDYINFDRPQKSHVNRDVFLKDNKFSYQREFRFKFDLPENTGKNHSYIDIGNISDIACLPRWSDHI